MLPCPCQASATKIQWLVAINIGAPELAFQGPELWRGQSVVRRGVVCTKQKQWNVQLRQPRRLDALWG
jgi:hypothetical protein